MESLSTTTPAATVTEAEDNKEVWTTSKIIEELHCDLISAKGEDDLCKYEEKARFLIYRIPIWRKPETGNKQPPDFTINLKDVSEEVKEQITLVSKIEARSIVKEAVSKLFENLGLKEKEYFNKSVRHLLNVRFIQFGRL